MKFFALLILAFFFSISFLSNGQEVVVDSIKIEYKFGRPVSKNFHLHSASKISGKGKSNFEKIKAQVKIESLNGKPVNPNSFSLLDTVNKIRYRMIEFLGWLPIGGHSAKTLLKEPLLKKNGKPYKYINAKYDPSKIDTFEDYSFDGYENLELPTVFPKKTRIVVYYDSVSYDKFGAHMFFMVLLNANTPVLELYYGKEKIGNIDLD